MPPRQYSRYLFSIGFLDDEERTILFEPDPFLFVDYPDNIPHEVVEGDMLWSLAAKYFKGLPRPSGLYWIISDFQPTPIVDPTLALEAGTIVFVPSIRTVVEDVFNANRRPRLQ